MGEGEGLVPAEVVSVQGFFCLILLLFKNWTLLYFFYICFMLTLLFGCAFMHI